MTEGRRVFKNSVFMGGGAIVGGVILLAAIVVTARYLGPMEFGDFILAVTFASLFQLFADGGIVSITIRDIARSPDQGVERLAKANGVVWIITIVLFALLALFAEGIVTQPHHRALAYCMGGAALMALHASLYAGMARAHEDMGFVALLGVVHKALLLGLVVTAIAFDLHMRGVAGAHLLANLFYLAVCWTYVRRRYAVRGIAFDRQHARYLLGEAMPLGAGVVIRRLNIHLCTILLTTLAGSTAVGLYNSAYRFLQMVEVGAVTLSSVLFPVFAKLYTSDRAGFDRLYAASLRVLVLISAPFAFLMLAIGDVLIETLYGSEYASAGIVLRVIGVSLVCLVPGAVLHGVFASAGRQASFMRLSALGIAVNVVLGLALIPVLASLGAAIATLVTEIVTLVVGAYLLSRFDVTTTYARDFVTSIVPAAIAAGVARGVPAMLGLDGWSIIVVGTALDVAVFTGLALVIGAFRLSEVEALVRRPPGSRRSPDPSPARG